MRLLLDVYKVYRPHIIRKILHKNAINEAHARSPCPFTCDSIAGPHQRPSPSRRKKC
ncbi:hypothetical protein BCR37DRAFT_375898, partial [Protomyces lactucae-debilis]